MLTLKYVVGVLDDQSDEESAGGVQHNHVPDEGGVAVEEALKLHECL